MKLLKPALAALMLASPAFADEANDAATAFINSPVQQKLLNDMLSPEMVLSQMQANAGGALNQEQIDVLVKIVTEELNAIRPQMEEAMIVGAAEAFSIDEINALNEFYNSEIGGSAMSKMTPYMQSTMGSLGPSIQAMQQNIARRAQEALQ
ncbi:MAG: DUF2059 domain-containing protein [Pseudomonadota bacterium]